MEKPAQVEAGTSPMDQQFQNDRVRVEVRRRPGCIARLAVEMTPEAVKNAYEKAVRAIKKEVSIPGFRKGKVPEDIVKHNFSSAIAKEHKDTVLQLAFTESLALTGLKPFSKNSLLRSELKKYSVDTGA